MVSLTGINSSFLLISNQKLPVANHLSSRYFCSQSNVSKTLELTCWSISLLLCAFIAIISDHSVIKWLLLRLDLGMKCKLWKVICHFSTLRSMNQALKNGSMFPCELCLITGKLLI